MYPVHQQRCLRLRHGGADGDAAGGKDLCFLGLRQGSGDGARGETILLAAGTEGGPDGDRPPYGEYKGQPGLEADAAGV